MDLEKNKEALAQSCNKYRNLVKVLEDNLGASIVELSNLSFCSGYVIKKLLCSWKLCGILSYSLGYRRLSFM